MKVFLTLVLLGPAFAAEVTPVQKVIQLMEGMLAKGQNGYGNIEKGKKQGFIFL